MEAEVVDARGNEEYLPIFDWRASTKEEVKKIERKNGTEGRGFVEIHTRSTRRV